jgi:hypothetical protein
MSLTNNDQDEHHLERKENIHDRMGERRTECFQSLWDMCIIQLILSSPFFPDVDDEKDLGEFPTDDEDELFSEIVSFHYR